MFLMVLSVFLTRFYLRAQETPSPHRDFIDALWVATSREILKVAVSDGTILFKVPDTEKVRAVAVDQRGSVVWAYGYKTLSAYAFNGEALFSVSVPQPDNVDGSENGKDKGQNENNGNGNDNVVLNVNPNNGTVWLGQAKLLYLFNIQGELLNTLILSDKVQALALDQATSRLWVATKTTVNAYDDSGTVIEGAIDLGKAPDVQDIDLDGLSGELWVALKNTLRRYAPDGTLLFETSINKPKHVSSDGAGGLWVGTIHSLIRLGPFGEVLFVLDGFNDDDKIVALVTDPVGYSVWVASKKALSHIGPNGESLHSLEFKGPDPVLRLEGRIWDLAHYADIDPPQITIDTPLDGSQVHTSKPDIQVSYNDVGSGVDPSTLRFTATANGNDLDLDVNCTPDDEGATCSPRNDLSAGIVILTVTIKDFAGNTSQPDEVRFTIGTVDVTPPVINFTSPNNGAEINTSTPTLQVSYSDIGSGIDTASYRMLVNGADVTSSNTVTSSAAAYTTKVPLLPGDNEATAIISDLAGNTQSATIRFNVSVFRAIANCSPAQGETPLEVRFRGRGEFHGGSIVRYRWDFEGDGVFDTSDQIVRDFSHKFDETGTFDAVLQVMNNFGETTTDTCTIAVSAVPPVAKADVNPSNGPAPLTVTFTGTGLEKNGEIVLHEWDFDGDGIFDFATSTFDAIPGPTAITFFLNHATCGPFNAFNFFLNDVLIGTTPGTIGCVCNPSEPSFTITDSVALSNWNETGVNMLRVDFGSSLAVGYVRAELTFQTSTVDVCIFDQKGESCAPRNLCEGFRFGGSFSAPVADGETTSTVNHTYTSQGMFNAVFRVTDNEGLMATAPPVTTSVRVGPPGTPVVEATASPTSGSEALTVSFNGSATDDGTITTWEWDFDGDGVFDFSSSTSPQTLFTYTNAGNFTAALRATDNTGLTSTDLIEITVDLTPTLSIPDDTIKPTAGETALIQTTLSAGAPIRILLKDRNGAVVRTLIAETRAAGSYSDTWDGKDEAGQLLPQGPYYAVLEYELNGETRSHDLTHTTGGFQYTPSRSFFAFTFKPLEDNLLRITFTIPSSRGASEILAVIGLLRSNTRFITLLEQVPLGVGGHTIYWDGLDSNGNFALPPPGDRFILGLIGFTLPDNAIFLEAAPVISNVTVDPNYFDPSTPDFITPADPAATITYDLDKVADIELTVTNLKTGRVLRRIRQTNVPAGTGHSISWDGHASDGLFADKGDYRLTLQAIDTTGSPSLLRFVLMRVFY